MDLFLFFNIFAVCRIAGLPEKNKFRPLKWGLAPFTKKIRGPEKDNVDNIPLKTDIVKQINYLVDYLSAEESEFFYYMDGIFLTLF